MMDSEPSMRQAGDDGDEDDSSDNSEELYAVYEGYAQTLRTWFVAYGIGGPVLFLSSDVLREQLVASGWAPTVSILFLMGVVLQVVLAAVNKTAMWGCYYGEIEPGFCGRWQHRTCCWVAKQFWIDLIVDVASLVLFAVGTGVVLLVFT